MQIVNICCHDDGKAPGENIDKLLQRLCHNHRVQMDLDMMTSWYGNAFRIVRAIAGIHRWLMDSPE